MHICLVCDQYGIHWTGVGSYTTVLANGLAERGHQVTVVCAEHGDCDRRVRVVKPVGPSVKPTLSRWFFSACLLALTVEKLRKVESFDVIHYTDGRNALFSSAAHLPVVGTVHDYYFVEAERSIFFYKKHYADWFARWAFYQTTRYLERRALRKLSFVISNSNYVKDAIVEGYGISKKAVKTVYIGVEEVGGVPTSIEQTAVVPRILFVGSNFQRKGLTTLIRAIALLREKIPAISLDVVGSDKMLSRFRELCRRLGVNDNVTFLGRVSPQETRLLFARYNLFAMPSMVEGFGLVFLEAMAAGIPVIGGNVGGTRELICHGHNGLLVAPNDPESLAERIVTVLDDEALRVRMIRDGFDTVSRFSVAKMIEETVDVYRAVAA